MLVGHHLLFPLSIRVFKESNISSDSYCTLFAPAVYCIYKVPSLCIRFACIDGTFSHIIAIYNNIIIAVP